jgi:hypothetical protein
MPPLKRTPKPSPSTTSESATRTGLWGSPSTQTSTASTSRLGSAKRDRDVRGQWGRSGRRRSPDHSRANRRYLLGPDTRDVSSLGPQRRMTLSQDLLPCLRSRRASGIRTIDASGGGGSDPWLGPLPAGRYRRSRRELPGSASVCACRRTANCSPTTIHSSTPARARREVSTCMKAVIASRGCLSGGGNRHSWRAIRMRPV